MTLKIDSPVLELRTLRIVRLLAATAALLVVPGLLIASLLCAPRLRETQKSYQRDCIRFLCLVFSPLSTKPWRTIRGHVKGYYTLPYPVSMKTSSGVTREGCLGGTARI